MTESPHILVVDDDQRLRDLLKQFLAGEGFMVSAAANGAEARRKLEGLVFDVLVVDIMMPGETGLDLVRYLRQKLKTKVPLLLLSAKGEIEDRIIGLESGADDYLPKPFDPRELVARLKSLLRRSDKEESDFEDIRLGAFSFNYNKEILKNAEGKFVHLTPTERDLLAALTKKRGQGMTRSELALTLGEGVDERNVDVQVARLRRKIEVDPKMPRYLQTLRGVGYMLVTDD